MWENIPVWGSFFLSLFFALYVFLIARKISAFIDQIQPLLTRFGQPNLGIKIPSLSQVLAMGAAKMLGSFDFGSILPGGQKK